MLSETTKNNDLLCFSRIKKNIENLRMRCVIRHTYTNIRIFVTKTHSPTIYIPIALQFRTDTRSSIVKIAAYLILITIFF